MWYVYYWWYLSPTLVVLRSYPPYILTLWWYLERQIFSEVVLGVKRLRTTDLMYPSIDANLCVLLAANERGDGLGVVCCSLGAQEYSAYR